ATADDVDRAAPSERGTTAPPTARERARRIVRRLRTFADERSLRALERLLADEAAPDGLRLTAAQSLAWRGRPVVGPRTHALLLAGATSGDPDVRHPAVFALAREPDAARALLEDAIAADRAGADSLAALLVTRAGAAARAPRREIARDVDRPPSARAAAIHGLRRFRSVDTTFELLWIYDPAQPRVLRDELCAAFEDLPRTEEARSGLISALADPDSNLRLRAFRLLLAVGASTAEEVDLLWPRIQAEPVEWVRRRMERLMATYASGDGARAFAYRVLRRLDHPEPEAAAAARATLENLGDDALRAEIGREVAGRLGAGALDDGTYRLLTRLGGKAADERAAVELARRFDAGATDPILTGLVALRAGGAGRTLGVALRGLECDDRDVRLETFRSLFERGVNAAFPPFVGAYDGLQSEERIELIGTVRFPSAAEAARGLDAVLAREDDPVVKAAIVQRAGELRAPMIDRLVALVDDETERTLRVAVAESLAAIGGDTAADVLRGWFEEAAARVRGEEADGADDEARLWLESTARAVARTGRVDGAVPLAALLLMQAPALEAAVYDTDAAFPFEVTVMHALLDLARTSGRPYDVAAALEVEVERARQSGLLALLPKALYVGLADALKGAPAAFDPLRAQFLDLAYRLPPRNGRRELPAAARLAELAMAERDHARAAHHLARSVVLIELLGVEGGRWLKETLGDPAPHAGFEPRVNLKARARLAEARAHAVLGEDEAARTQLAAAAALAPYDAWLHYAIAADVATYELGADVAARFATKARRLAPADARLALHVGRLLSDLDADAAARAAIAAYETERDAGLEPDTADARLALAETLVRLEEPARARRELEAARTLDPARTEEHLRNSPRLRELEREEGEEGRRGR
ncbi:MAG: HEAT repeat domain-containing protein, partial [Planctomycetota bacterium JB042]